MESVDKLTYWFAIVLLCTKLTCGDRWRRFTRRKRSVKKTVAIKKIATLTNLGVLLCFNTENI